MPSATPLVSLCQQATFIKSASQVEQCPLDRGYEVAFAGRSNAGKSSALNTLTHARLARTSKTPGRTQLINFFGLDEQRRLVDLPGYGYAKVPLALKEHWKEHLDAYLTGRESLAGLVLVMDIRHPLSDFDRMMLEWSDVTGLPAHILLSKADKLAYGAAKNVLLKVPLCSCFQHPSVRVWRKPTRYWKAGSLPTKMKMRRNQCRAITTHNFRG